MPKKCFLSLVLILCLLPLTTSVFAAKNVKITFDANGGQFGDATTQVMTKKVGAPLRFPTPSRNGYTFEGWFTNQTDGEKVEADAKAEKKITYYAHWSVVPTEPPKETKRVVSSVVLWTCGILFAVGLISVGIGITVDSIKKKRER